MWTLGFDTTASTVAVALTKNGVPFASYSADSATSHSTTLLPAIENLLSAAGITPSELSLIACSAGPGSFTGVRIGVSTAKGLAAPFDTSCVGVSSLEAMAYMFKEIKCIVCPVLNARRSNVYTAVFASDGNGFVRRLTDDDLVSLDSLPEFISSVDTKGYEALYLTGDSISQATRALDGFKPLALCPTPSLLASPSGYGVASCANEIYASAGEDKSMFNWKSLMPIYLRKSQAEREKDEKTSK